MTCTPPSSLVLFSSLPFSDLDYTFLISDSEEPLASYFTRIPYLEEDEIYQLSLEREPRGAVAKDLV